MTLGLLIRLELMQPGQQFYDAKTYNTFFTLHGVIMIFLFIVPGIPAIFGNFILPLQLGAEDVAFPKLNLASWYVYMAGAVIALTSLFAGSAPPDTGWTFYAPYSLRSGGAVSLAVLGAFVLGFSSILTGMNFITTIHRLRAKGMGFFRMPLFCWGLYATSWIQVIATPVVGITLLLVTMERTLGIGFFDPARGGDPILYQHLFWIYSHPVVYVMILPAMGVISEILPTFAGRTIFGYKAIAMSSMAIAIVGYMVWGHHMFTVGMSDTARWVFSLLTFLVAIPTGIKVFNWMATLYRGSIEVKVPLLYALGFIFLFSIGGLTGLVNGRPFHRHPRARHGIHRGPFPLHHVRRCGHRHVCRAALLVPQDVRAQVQREDGHLGLGPDHGWVQHPVLPHADPGHDGHAPPLPRLFASVPGAARRQHGGIVDPGHRNHPHAGEPHQGHPQRREGRGQSLGRHHPGVENLVAAALAELR